MSEEPLRGASQDFNKRLISDEALNAASLPEVAPIEEAIGVHKLILGKGSGLGVGRSPTGNVGVLYVDIETRTQWTLVLEPAEAKWLRETLGKMGY